MVSRARCEVCKSRPAVRAYLATHEGEIKRIPVCDQCFEFLVALRWSRGERRPRALPAGR